VGGGWWVVLVDAERPVGCSKVRTKVCTEMGTEELAKNIRGGSAQSDTTRCS
jgi:hypothetical protein